MEEHDYKPVSRALTHLLATVTLAGLIGASCYNFAYFYYFRIPLQRLGFGTQDLINSVIVTTPGFILCMVLIILSVAAYLHDCDLVLDNPKYKEKPVTKLILLRGIEVITLLFSLAILYKSYDDTIRLKYFAIVGAIAFALICIDKLLDHVFIREGLIQKNRQYAYLIFLFLGLFISASLTLGFMDAKGDSKRSKTLDTIMFKARSRDVKILRALSGGVLYLDHRRQSIEFRSWDKIDYIIYGK